MNDRGKSTHGAALSLALLGCVFLASHATVRSATAAHAAAAPSSPEPGARPGRESTDARSPEVRDLDRRIKALRDELHAQVDPLQSQIKALRDRLEPQIKALEDQRRTLVEEGKPSSIQQLDQDETHELADLGDREKAEIDKVHQRFADERHAIQQKYDERRAEARGGSK